MTNPYAPLKQRFKEKCSDPDANGCINWIGAKNKGYGIIENNRKRLSATKVSYELAFGPVPDGLYLRHKCDNPGCVNPDHLVPGTQQENLDDMVSRDRQKRSRYSEADIERMRDLKRQGLTQILIAEYFGCTQSAVSMLLRGKMRPMMVEAQNGSGQ